jgi:hypothetical protein
MSYLRQDLLLLALAILFVACMVLRVAAGVALIPYEIYRWIRAPR